MITPNRKLILTLLMLFIGESAVMGLINFLQLPAYIEAFVDASVLIIIALPILYIQFVRPMIQQYRVVEEARQTAETLLNTSIELSQSLELKDVTSILLRRVRELLSNDTAAIYITQSPDWLALRALEGVADGENSPNGIDPGENATLEDILSNQKHVLISDVQENSGELDLIEAKHARAWLGIPLISGGKVIGVCGFGHRQPSAFSPAQVRLAEGLVSLSSVAIQNACLYEQVLAARQQMQTLTHQTVDIHERERRLLSRDLYDDAGQALASVLLKVHLLSKNAGNRQATQKRAEELHAEISQIMENLQNMAVNLRPASLEHLGLVAAIQHDLDRLRVEKGLVARFDPLGTIERLPERTETALYRIVQEALSNVVEHACASKVEVSLSRQPDYMVLVVSDNGQGFRVEPIDANCCLGLLGMRERAEMVGGQMAIESEPGGGTSVIVRVPVI